MALNLTGIPDYVNQSSKELVTKAVVESKTIQYLNGKGYLRVGVKGKEAIQLLDADVNLQDGTACGRNPLGDTDFSQVILEIAHLKDEQNYCPRDFEAKWMSQYLTKGANYTDLLFAAEMMAARASKIAAANEKLIWQGDKDSVDANLNKFDGFLQLLADGGAGTVSVSGDIVSQLQGIIGAVKPEILASDDFAIFVGQDVAVQYQIALANKNLFDPANPLKVLGTDVDIVGVPGLTGTNKAVAGRASHLIVGTDLVSDTDTATMDYSVETKQFYMDFRYALGVAVAYPEDFVVATLSAPSSAYTLNVSTMSVDEQNITNSTVENQTVTGA